MIISLPAKVISVSKEKLIVELKCKTQKEEANPENITCKEKDYVSVIMPNNQLTVCSRLNTRGHEAWMW
jgi:hypothetical protein